MVIGEDLRYICMCRLVFFIFFKGVSSVVGGRDKGLGGIRLFFINFLGNLKLFRIIWYFVLNLE